MNKKLATKLLVSSTMLLTFASCNKTNTPTLESITATSGLNEYSVGYQMKKDDFTVTATYSDKSSVKLENKDFNVDVSLPHTFTDEETLTGKDFKISYKTKETTVHVAVKSNDGKSQITFKNYDGTILQNGRITKGEEISYEGDVPVKPISGDVSQNIFIGWDKELGTVKENTVFTAQYKEIKKYIDNDHDGIPFGVDTNDNDNHFDVGVKSMVYLDQNIDIDFSKFLETNANLTYDNNLAKLGLFMSNPKVDFKDGLFSDKAYGGRENALYSRLGFDDFHHFDFTDEAKTYKYDSLDATSGVYGHKYLYNKNNEKVRDLIVIAFEGTKGDSGWSSNFDIGYDDPIYYQKIANSSKEEKGTSEDHPEWTDKSFHKGFYIGASRVLNDKVDGGSKEGPVKFLKYIQDHTTEGFQKPIVFVTGHSRGGAMAAIVGEYLEHKYVDENQEKKVVPFTYTFAAPSVWGSGESKPNTSTVFNVVNDDDLVTKVPFSEWGFTRLGHDQIVKSAADYKDLYDQNRDKRPYEHIDGKVQESIFHNLGCTGRDKVYDLTTKLYASNTALNEEPCLSPEAAKEEISRLNGVYSQMLGDFFKYIQLEAFKEKDFSGNDVYNIYANACIGTVTALARAFILNDEKVINNIADVFALVNNDKFQELALSMIIQVLPEGKDKIGLPHDYGAYQIILREYKGQ